MLMQKQTMVGVVVVVLLLLLRALCAAMLLLLPLERLLLVASTVDVGVGVFDVVGFVGCGCERRAAAGVEVNHGLSKRLVVGRSDV